MGKSPLTKPVGRAVSASKLTIPQTPAQQESSRLFQTAADWTIPQAGSRTTVMDVTFLRQFSEILRDAETVEDLCGRVCRHLHEHLPFQEITLALAGESGEFAEVFGSFDGGDASERRTNWPWDEFAAALAECSTTGFELDPASAAASFFFHKKFTSALIVPLQRRLSSALHASHELVLHGALAVSLAQAQKFHAAQREQLQALANLISGVVAHIRKTQPRAAETALLRREKELENLVFVISHNLKTPIVSIQGFASLLRDELEPQLQQEHAHFLDRILKNAALMEKMIQDLLEFHRLGRENAKREWIDLQSVVSRVIDDLKLLEQTSLSPSAFGKPAAGAKTAKADFVLPPHLPRLLADAQGLKTVFENLLSNAMKYRQPQAPLRVEIGWQEQPRFHAFWVRDNGMGMDAAFQQKAFNLFQRGANAGKIAGSGVGLAIVRRIIEKHQGLIELDSAPGQGTSVYFTLPKLDQLESGSGV